ncbi:hypothetical protein Celaphus_00018491 [Cervus elaphus hippelaphus]|uniref:Peroxiredoxin-1 n=1 Tax=Cervus elaphus hippelaphus TaxID=46360 RepID=A0A212CLW1_CEREH|nr:hypothetical protein Celaphus_00018491 [Cervus elaphus hippelaphus]
MPDDQFKDTSPSDYKGRYDVFVSYPLDLAFVCPVERIAFSDRAEEFKKLSCQVTGASVVLTSVTWCGSAYPRKKKDWGHAHSLISEPEHTVAQYCGVLKADEGFSFRNLFITDDEGIFRQITIKDLPVGRSVDERLRLVQAFPVH